PLLAWHVRLRIRRREFIAAKGGTVWADRLALASHAPHTTRELAWRTAACLRGLHRGQRLARLSLYDGDRARWHAGNSARNVRGGSHRWRGPLATVLAYHAPLVDAGPYPSRHAWGDLDF